MWSVLARIKLCCEEFDVGCAPLNQLLVEGNVVRFIFGSSSHEEPDTICLVIIASNSIQLNDISLW
jgi:hypothetical protein